MLKLLMAGLIGLAATTASFAQSYGVPAELLKNTRRMDGDKLQVCVDITGKLQAFDRAVATALAEALFLKPEFHEGFGGYPTSGEGFLDELQIAMTNSCDVMLGMTVQENSPYPEWAVLSRPYVSLPYMLAVKDDYKALTDIPKSRKLGTALSSMGERVFITWNQQQPKEQRFIRLPYADMDLMTKRVADGSIAGMVIWQPVFAELQKSNPEAAGLHTIPLAPVPDTVTRVGILMKARDSYLRSQIDEAIDALVEDGTIAAIMEDFGYTGTAGDAKGVQ
ncbi:transporter substrate-binding domain-containing protein [Paracoccus cavernae]|uniref:Transporter substrate-binding domain-containing protein n=1 Tax=Paracoccus cavernae TaxID=1571207 RepID=A0ABT8D1M4_9RHOB|nr:transporter substrate-binding domain-containing protein [Paracoccus cavernae]